MNLDFIRGVFSYFFVKNKIIGFLILLPIILIMFL